VQWKAATNLSSWVQHAGHEGLAVMLIEKSTFETNLAAAPIPEPGESVAAESQVGGKGQGQWGRGGYGCRGCGGHGS